MCFSVPSRVLDTDGLVVVSAGEEGEFGTADESDLGQLAAIGRALRSLPVNDMMFAAHTRGSAVLALNRSRRLN